MGKITLWGGWVLALALASAAATGALAAQPTRIHLWQDAPTSTPEPGEGQVAARVLVVRAGASSEWVAIGGLNEGETIEPLGVSPDGDWIMIEWEGRQGWVSADFVEWPPGYDPSGLPTVPPPTPAPRTATPAAPTITPTRPSPTAPSPTPSAPPTRTPAPSATPSPTTMSAPTASASPAQAAALPPASPPSAASGTQPGIVPGVERLPLPWLGGGGAAFILAAGIYIWQRSAGRRELARYAGGFLLDACPTCQRGELHLDEQVKRPLGVLRVQRTVRCDTCRSVLRQVRPGVWRYTIDPLANPDLAERFSPRIFADAALLAFAEQARSFEPLPESESLAPASPHFQSTVEHLATLEANVLASQQTDEKDEDGEVDETASEAGPEESASEVEAPPQAGEAAD